MAHHARGHPDDESSTMHVVRARHVSVLGGLVHDLIEGRVHIVCELDLCHGLHALARGTDGEADQALLAQRRVEDAFGPEISSEVHGRPEDTAKLHILAEDNHSLVGLQGMAEGLVDGLVQVDALGLASAHVLGQLRVGKGSLRGVVEQRCSIVVDGPVETCAGHCG